MRNISEQSKKTIEETEKIFARSGKKIVKNGMRLISDRLKFAASYDEKLREAICAIEDNESEKASGKKALMDALRQSVPVGTKEALDLVVSVLERLNAGDAGTEKNELFIKLDEKVEKWAK